MLVRILTSNVLMVLVVVCDEDAADTFIRFTLFTDVTERLTVNLTHFLVATTQ